MMTEIPKTLAVAVALVTAACLAPFMIESNTSGQTLIITSPSGHISVFDTPGYHFQGFGSAVHYNKRGQLKFDKGEEGDKRISIRYNDGGTSLLSGTLNYELSSDPAKMKDLHSQYMSEEAVRDSLVGTALQRAVFASGATLSSTESYSTKRSDLFSLVGGQLREGIYATSGTIVDKDKNNGVATARVSLQVDPTTGRPIIVEKSVLERYGITIPTLSISGVTYDERVQKQMEAQLESLAAIQTGVAENLRNEQEAKTALSKGLTQKAVATAAANVEKEKATIAAEQEKEVAITKATQQREVAQLALESTKLEGEAVVAKGKAEAEARKLALEADNGLKQKLEAYTTTQQAWANAFKEIKVPIVPSTILGGGTNTNSLENIMGILSAKAAADLNVDLSIDKK